MKITLAAIADYASISIEQKLHVLGIFDTIYSPRVPAAHPRAVLVVRTLAEHEDSGKENSIEMRLEDEDGAALFKGMAKAKTGEIPAGGTRASNLIIELNNLPIPKFGRYSFVLAMDGVEAFRLPLRVEPVPQRPAAPPA